jgi:hypothetical protein
MSRDRIGVAADWVSLAAAPTFAIMALLTAITDGSHAAMLSSHAGQTSPLTGMMPMYMTMAAFHSPAWLKLLSR